jgi:hypothetical protein
MMMPWSSRSTVATTVPSLDDADVELFHEVVGDGGSC